MRTGRGRCPAPSRVASWGIRLLAVAIFGLLLAPSALAQTDRNDTVWDQVNRLGWVHSGSVGRIGEQASLSIPKGHAFLGSADTRRFLELQGNPPRDNHYTIAPQDLRWFAVFLFNPMGYVKDDEKLDPDTLLATLKEANAAGQAERKQRGLPELVLEGWYVAPHYDLATKRLEWGTRLRSSSNETIVNYTIKLLGRRGVMNAILVSDPTRLESDTREFKTVLNAYSFNDGEKYAEFRAGDKIAEFGLAGLIVGGAAAAAMKSGAFKGLFKFIGIAVLGGIGALWGLLRRRPRST
jgi:uncharacterized membrane-anchored protein